MIPLETFVAAVAELAADAHGAEVGAAHGAVLAAHVVGLLVVLEGPFGVEAEVELVFPAELEAGLAQGIVPYLCPGMALGQVGSMGGYLIGDDTDAHVLLVREGQVLLWGHVAEHGGAEPAYLCGAYGTGNVVVAGGYVGDDGAEGVEGGIVAFFYLPLHVLGYLVHGHVAGTFDEGLYVPGPGPLYQLAHSVQLGELGRVVGVTDGSWTQAVTE